MIISNKTLDAVVSIFETLQDISSSSESFKNNMAKLKNSKMKLDEAMLVNEQQLVELSSKLSSLQASEEALDKKIKSNDSKVVKIIGDRESLKEEQKVCASLQTQNLEEEKRLKQLSTNLSREKSVFESMRSISENKLSEREKLVEEREVRIDRIQAAMQ